MKRSRSLTISLKFDGSMSLTGLPKHTKNNASTYSCYGAIAEILDSESVTLKLKVSDIDDLVENWYTNLLLLSKYTISSKIAL